VLNPGAISLTDLERYSGRARSSNVKNMPDNPTQLLNDYVDMLRGRRPVIPPPKNQAGSYGPPGAAAGTVSAQGAPPFTGGVTEDKGLPRGIFPQSSTHWEKNVTEPEMVEKTKEEVAAVVG
jgi:hypothetical protein